MQLPSTSRLLPIALSAVLLAACSSDDSTPATETGDSMPAGGSAFVPVTDPAENPVGQPGVAPVVVEDTQRQQDLAALGERMFNDSSLSTPATISCATCHSADRAFTDPRGGPVSAGAVEGLVGNRNAPSVSYSAFVPALAFVSSEEDGVIESDWRGGLFWDGRADSLEIQALAPIRNHLEQNVGSDEGLVDALAAADYAAEIERLFGDGTLSDTGTALAALSTSIAAFERSAAVSPFSSRFDDYLAGENTLNAQELSGLALFDDPEKGNCSACHTLNPEGEGEPVVFTDHSYDNLGIPKNEANPFLDLSADDNPDGRDFVDLGLFRTTGRIDDIGRFRVPTLRNVEVTAPYGHNGFFATLEEIVHFYNVKNDGSLGAPEVPETANEEEIGALGLSEAEEADIVAFMKTLTDR